MLKKSDTYNSTAKRYDFPQSPSRVQLSLWPAGLSSNGKGTIDWAGGLIDWQSKDIQNNKYYYAAVKDVSMECYDAPSGTKASGQTSYVYTKDSGTQDVIEITDKPTVLKSLLGTGTNMTAGDPALKPSTKGKVDAPVESEPASIPGLSGAGTGGTAAAKGTDKSKAEDADSVAKDNPAASSATSLAPPKASTTGFSQGSSASGSGPSSDASALGRQQGEKVLRGSLFAGLVAVGGALLL